MTKRDMECRGIIVRRECVKDEEMAGKFALVKLLDGSLKKHPIAKIKINTPLLRWEVDALCVSGTLCDLIIGNVLGARPANDPHPSWLETARSVAERPRKRPE